MEKQISFIDYKSFDFYFLYFKNFIKREPTHNMWQEHSFYEIMFFEEGKGEYVIENRRYFTKKGDVLLIKPGCYHFKEKSDSDISAVYCLGFLSDAIGNAGLAKSIFDRCEYLSIGADSPLFNLMNVAKNKLSLSKNNASAFIKAIAEATVLMLCDLDVKSECAPEIKNPSVQRMLDFINENLCSIHKVDDIAAALFFSESYTRTLFKREMGIGIMEYVRNKKLLLAHRKMRHGKKPTEIYLECGFSSYPSFYRAYIAYFGKKPKSPLL